MDNYNAVVASYKVMQEALNVSQSTIKRSVNYLSKNGYIHIAKSGTSNVYILNPQIAWKSWATNKAYCEFPAKVVLAQSEQENQDFILKNKKINTIQAIELKD